MEDWMGLTGLTVPQQRPAATTLLALATLAAESLRGWLRP
jgi:hypothetical protein